MCNGEAMSACFTLETTEQISMKFGIEGFYVKLWSKFKLVYIIPV